MSTNKTENYHLHAWELEDNFLLSEINENFTAIDVAITGRCRMVCGVYSGNNTANRLISLGFTPKAVMVNNAKGQTSSGRLYGGIALPGHPAGMGGTPEGLEVVEGGFQVSPSTANLLNESGKVYHYIAFE